jgi:hypothetical protein
MPLSLLTAGDARFGKSVAVEEAAEFGYTFTLSVPKRIGVVSLIQNADATTMKSKQSH